MQDQRPHPDELLKRAQEEEIRQSRGKLKLFFGATAGVGKTYAMLEAAHVQQEDGVDVVVGWVETHKRSETEALLEGLEILPPRIVEYQGVKLREFDLDAALARRPTLILMDELAHTNAPGSRHAKRWQDVQELLGAGINVYTTVNVQHLESLNDVVTQITGVIVRETVPDSLLEQADDVELIDLTPDDLLQRLKEGKVYVPEQAREAIENFFKKGNLIALRELALRQTADRVDEQMQVYRRDHAVARTWPAAECIMVCVNLKSRGPRLIRAARRMAAGLHAKWLAVYVQTSRHLGLPEPERERVIRTLRLAERLGAETVTLSGDNVSQEILNYARKRNVTKIIVGKPVRSRWKEWVFGSVVADLVRNSGEIDVYVITGEAGEERPRGVAGFQPTSNRWAYGQGVMVVAACSALAWGFSPYLAQANLVMLYLLGVVVVATRLGRGPSILASILSVVTFNFLFVPPYLSFSLSNTQYIMTFGVMLLIALQISRLTGRIRQQAEVARQRAWRTEVLYAMSREFATTRLVENLTKVAIRHIHEVFDSEVEVLLPDGTSRLVPQTGQPGSFTFNEREKGVAQWAFEHNEAAGLGTETLPGAGALYLPLVGSQGTVGVLAVRPAKTRSLLSPEQRHLLETFAGQFALAIERARLAQEAQQALVQAETERMRNAILSSVSHDLRTPLATITGAASSLLEGQNALGSLSRQELIRAIYNEANRLDMQVRNLLDMTRLEAGAVQLQKEWHPLEEVAGAALTRLEGRLQGHPVRTDFPSDLPLVLIDGVLIEQVLINLLENAIKYTPPGTPIDLSASVVDKAILFEVADRGPGLPAGEEQRIFDKFYRARPTPEGGVGLGLSICRGIVEAHGGRIWAENRPGGGAVFRFTLPLEGSAPGIEPEKTNLHEDKTRSEQIGNY
jgi:two-component system sensor histidine kinase KdpD